MPPERRRLIVSDQAKRSTEECTKDFACLKGNLAPCKLEQCLGREVLVCLNKEYCPYQIRFGFADYLCSCPIRKELYEKYHM